MASLWMKSINSPNFISPISFTSAIRQTLTPPNIPAIWYSYFLFLYLGTALEGGRRLHSYTAWLVATNYAKNLHIVLAQLILPAFYSPKLRILYYAKNYADIKDIHRPKIQPATIAYSSTVSYVCMLWPVNRLSFPDICGYN